MSEYKKIKRNNENGDIHPMQEYQGFQMYFFKKPLNYKLTAPLELRKTKYNFKIKNMDPYDLNQLNKIFDDFTDKLQLGNGEYYLNSRCTRFLDEKYELIDFIESRKWILIIRIQGYKISNSGTHLPIWKIEEAKLVPS